jgi:hypothetical protein
MEPERILEILKKWDHIPDRTNGRVIGEHVRLQKNGF